MIAVGQPWIRSRAFDAVLILAPGILATLLVLALGGTWRGSDEVSLFGWFVLVVAIDVAHVYSTIYRTYVDSAERQRWKSLLITVPLVAWTLGTLLYSLDNMAFWRALAYLAVFHFVRQQYGFAMLYKRHERGEPLWARRIDQAVIYLATLYPLIYWHTHPRKFEWFIKGDFAQIEAPWLSKLVGGVYLATLAAFALKELRQLVRARSLNVPKNLIVLSTALSWYVGIVAFDGDLAFTLTNVVAHGVPYTALVWAYGRKKRERVTESRKSFVDLAYASVPLFVGLIFALAYVEEGFWDALVWREHAAVFPWMQWLPKLEASDLLSLVVPLLAVPQMTHYILDGFIWRLRDGKLSRALTDAHSLRVMNMYRHR